MDDSAEKIGRVVADIRSGNVRPVRTAWHAENREQSLAGEAAFDLALALVADPVVVDATAILEGLEVREAEVLMYEDHPCIAPPWGEAAICYVNSHGNVMVMHMNVVTDKLGAVPWDMTETADQGETKVVDEDRLRWRLDTFVWVGGRKGDGTPMKTMGPVHLWQFAVYDDGEPADLHWVHLVPDYPLKHWDMAHLTLLGTLNFMSCTNVDIATPTRPRAEARRVARTGVDVQTIHVRPAGGGRGRGSAAGPGSGAPVSARRGHFHHYGDCCPTRHEPKGLLFGRMAGKFWIPQIAVGDARTYEVTP